MKYLVTGGAGFIGSHLVEYLLCEEHHEVTVIDDFSTGNIENLKDVITHPNLILINYSILNEKLVERYMTPCDAVFHLASAVGVKLIMEEPVKALESTLGTHVVMKYASRYRKKVLITSSSEVYGKSEDIPFKEDGDRLQGATTIHRWAYACAKAHDEFLALAHYKKTGLPVSIVRLFNTVGIRQSSQYGMVLPRFIEQALKGEQLTVYGNGSQTRCFCSVHDVVPALYKIMQSDECNGEVINIGNYAEISIMKLAVRVIDIVSDCNGRIVHIDPPYKDGFEDMQRRVPCLDKAKRLIGFEPKITLDEIITEILESNQ